MKRLLFAAALSLGAAGCGGGERKTENVPPAPAPPSAGAGADAIAKNGSPADRSADAAPTTEAATDPLPGGGDIAWDVKALEAAEDAMLLGREVQGRLGRVDNREGGRE
jgi:hypothetical protein